MVAPSTILVLTAVNQVSLLGHTVVVLARGLRQWMKYVSQRSHPSHGSRLIESQHRPSERVLDG